MQPRYPRRSSDNNSNENNRKVKSNTFEGTIDLINGSIQKFLPFRENSVNSPLVLSILLTRIKKKAIFRLLLSPPLRILFKLCPEADDLFFFFFFPPPSVVERVWLLRHVIQFPESNWKVIRWYVLVSIRCSYAIQNCFFSRYARTNFYWPGSSSCWGEKSCSPFRDISFSVRRFRHAKTVLLVNHYRGAVFQRSSTL